MRILPTIVAVSLLLVGLAAASDEQDEKASGKKWVCPPCGVDCHDVEFDEPGTCPHPDCGMELIVKIEASEHRVRKVAICIWDGVELLDFAGPGEVFSSARTSEGPGFEVFTLAATKAPIVSQGFVTVQPEYSIDDCPAPDIVVLPGGGVSGARADERFMKWLREIQGETEVLLSVCTGAFILADLGLLDGKEGDDLPRRDRRPAPRGPEGEGARGDPLRRSRLGDHQRRRVRGDRLLAAPGGSLAGRGFGLGDREVHGVRLAPRRTRPGRGVRRGRTGQVVVATGRPRSSRPGKPMRAPRVRANRGPGRVTPACG